MDGQEFDELIKRLCTTRLTRWSVLRGLVAGAAAAVTGSTLIADDVEAKEKAKATSKKADDKNKADARSFRRRHTPVNGRRAR